MKVCKINNRNKLFLFYFCYLYFLIYTSILRGSKGRFYPSSPQKAIKQNHWDIWKNTFREEKVGSYCINGLQVYREVLSPQNALLCCLEHEKPLIYENESYKNT